MPEDGRTDQQHLRHAIELARRSFGLASPNPNVGAVLVDKGGSVVGEGFYTFEGVKHAEVIAIEEAGRSAMVVPTATVMT